MTGPFFRRVLGAVAILAASGPGAGHTQDLDDKSVFTAQFENDFFGKTDGHFTHGTRLAWMAPEGQVPQWVIDAASFVPLFDEKASKRVVFSLSQSIITPDDITVKELQPKDRPYAGWLSTGVGLVSVTGDRLDNLQVEIGIVGKHSFAEDAQTTWHEWFGFPRPQGWDHQIRDEPGFLLSYERKWRRWQRFHALGLDTDITPHAGANLGNVLTQGALGFTIRLGSDLTRHYDYGPPRIRPSMPGSDYFVSNGRFGWYIFLGAEGRGILHNIFLDGNTFRDSHSVDKRPFVGDVQGGIAFIIGPVRIAYTHIFRTKEFYSQDDTDQFGALSLSVIF